MKIEEMIEKLRYKANNIKAKIEPKFFNEVADVLEGKDINVTSKYDGWISIDDRLPKTDENRKYLVCGRKGGIYIAEFICNTVSGTPLKTHWWNAQGRYCPNPIAWMPLPEPYKEGEADENKEDH